MADNIIEFPRLKVDAPVQTAEDLQEKIREYKEEFANEIAEFIWRQAIGELVRSGCDFTQDMQTYFPSMMLVLESIRSLHLQSQGMPHTLQDFAKEAITIEDIEEFNEKMVDIEDDID